MKSQPARDEQGNGVIRAFENNGLLYGGLFGVLLGVLISGPHFNQWPLWKIVAASAVCALVIGLICRVAISLIWEAAAVVPAPWDTDFEGEADDHGPCFADID